MLTPAAAAARIAKRPLCEIGAVAQILKDMLLGRERRLTDPVRPLASHMGNGRGVAARNVHGHRVTADARERAAAFGYPRRRVVPTAGAEEGRALRLRRSGFQHLVER